MTTRGVYRDEAAAVRERIGELQRRVARCREQLERRVLANMRGLAAEVERLDTALSEAPPGHEGLLLRAELLDQLSERLEQALKLAPAVAEQLAALPEEAPDPERLGVPDPTLEPAMHGPMGDVPANTWQHMAAAADWAQALPETLKEISRGKVLKASFRTTAGPFKVAVRGGHAAEISGPPFTRGSQIIVSTSLALGAPRLSVSPENLVHTLLLKPLRLMRDTEVGSPSFDGQFIVQGARGDVERLLTPEVQQAMILIARQDPPCLEVRPGAAYLYWQYLLTVAGIGAAVEALGAIRNAPLAG